MDSFTADGGTVFDRNNIDPNIDRYIVRDKRGTVAVVPTDDMLQFVAKYVRERRMENWRRGDCKECVGNTYMTCEELEDAHWREVLGLPKEDH